jgi:hypothetical protein
MGSNRLDTQEAVHRSLIVQSVTQAVMQAEVVVEDDELHLGRFSGRVCRLVFAVKPRP